MPDEFFAPISNGGTPPRYKYFNGKDWVDSKSGKTTQIISPVDNSVVGELQVCTHEEIDEVMNKAYAAQTAWETTPLNQRINIVHLAADWVMEHLDYMINLMVMEIGKSVKESKSEIVRTAELTHYFAEEAQSMKGETIGSDNFPGYKKDSLAMIERVAHGVVLAIAPFNYPVNLSGSKIAPALLMGNSVVVKTPTQGGISGLHLVRIFEKAGVPEGVITCVTGGGAEIGDHLVSHPKVAMVTFTGSSVTGPAIAGKAPMKPLLFECGGNNPAIVFPDADMNVTASEIVKGGFSYTGQRCTAIKYVLGPKAVLDQLMPVVQQKMGELLKMGDPRNPETKMVGPVVSEKEAEKIQGAIDDAVKEGARVVVGGKHDKAYVEPTLLAGVKPSMKVVATEIFGPVVSFIEMDSMDEAAKMINESMFGLQACVFTKDEGNGIAFGRRLNVGTVQINGSPQRGPDHYPFLGVKKSGVGVQGVRYSLEAMSRIHPIVLNKPA